MLRIKVDSKLCPVLPAQPAYVPLKRVSVDATIRSFAADVTIKQIFRNDEATPIEAVYCFPIEEQAAIYSFIARIDDREIVAELKEKKEAQQEYTDALLQGHGAYLLEQDEKSQDNFIINVGALPAGKECHISISYVTELQLVQNASKIRFVIPTTIAPRYNPDKGGISAPSGTTSKYVQTSPYTVELLCRVDKFGIKSVNSMSHPIQIDLSQQDAYAITFAQQNTHLDRDILIDIDLAENRSNTIVALEPGAIMAAFSPNEEDCQRAMNKTETTNEFIFVVDCSGSMADENKIGLARQAMLLFLKSLPVDSHFNIVQFGSTHKALFPTVTEVYNEGNAQKAEQLTNHMQANLGGTELLRPLQWLQEHPPQQGRARQIFLLTDGEISNVDQVLELCRSMATSARIFSFGLGQAPSRSLVKGLARATNGRFVFIPPNSSVDTHVGEQLQKALQSCITNVQIKWNVKQSVMSVPTEPPPVYVNDRLIFYALSNDSTSVFDHDFTVELYAEQQRIGEAKITQVPHISKDGTIARLAAKALILELQHSKLPPKNTAGSLQTRFKEQTQPTTTPIADEKDATKKRIIELSLKYKILSPHTAFVGVEKRPNASNADMVLREVPIQISADDQQLQPTQFMSNFAMPPIMRRAMPNSAKMSSSNSSFGFGAVRTAAASLFSSNRPMNRQRGAERKMRCMDVDDLMEHDCCDEISSVITSPTSFSHTSSFNSERKIPEEVWPTGDENIVRYLISKQKFDGLWSLDAKNIEQLTGKPLTSFPQGHNEQLLIAAIVVVILETRFESLSTMWYGVVQKARKRLTDLLGKDVKKLDAFFGDILQRL